MRMIWALTALGLVFGASAVSADEPKKEDGKTIESKLEPCIMACTINFSKELGVPLNFLSGFGARVDEARKNADPVTLATLAQGLAAAEKAAGKSASLNAKTLMKEATDLAKIRQEPAELTAVVSLTADRNVQVELGKVLEKANEMAAKSKAGEMSKELNGTLRVENHSGECLQIYVSGRFVGTVHRNQTRHFHVHDYNSCTELEARCDGGTHASVHLDGPNSFYRWHIH